MRVCAIFGNVLLQVRIYAATSRNGVDFDLSWLYAGEALVPPGGMGSWDAGTMLPASRVVTAEGFHGVYYEASERRHEQRFAVGGYNAIGVARWKEGRMFHLRPDERCRGEGLPSEEACVVTHPFVLRGSRLFVDVAVSAGGHVQVRLLPRHGGSCFGGEGALAEGEPLLAAGEVAWRGESLSSRMGIEVRLSFEFQDARLYSFRFPAPG